MPLALALDLGTTSIAAAAVAPDGRLAAHEQLPNDAAVTGLAPGHTEQNPLRIREIACHVLRRLSGGLNDTPACLGITGQMHGGLVVDTHRWPVTNLITWQDRRANLPASHGSQTWLDLLLEKCPADELTSTGCRPAAGFLAVTLFVLGQQGVSFSGTETRAACVADWIAAELTDGPIVTDPGDAASWGVYDLEHRRWNATLLKACGLSPELMPDVRESGAVLGGLSRAMAEVRNLAAGLPE